MDVFIDQILVKFLTIMLDILFSIMPSSLHKLSTGRRMLPSAVDDGTFPEVRYVEICCRKDVRLKSVYSGRTKKSMMTVPTTSSVINKAP